MVAGVSLVLDLHLVGGTGRGESLSGEGSRKGLMLEPSASASGTARRHTYATTPTAAVPGSTRASTSNSATAAAAAAAYATEPVNSSTEYRGVALSNVTDDLNTTTSSNSNSKHHLALDFGASDARCTYSYEQRQAMLIAACWPVVSIRNIPRYLT